MYEYVEKSKENTASADRRKSRAVANSVAQKKNSGKQGFGFVDNRSEAIVHRKLQEMTNNNPQANQATQLQPMNAAERAAYRSHVFNMGIRDTPIENAAGYHEQRSTIGGFSSYPHGSPSNAASGTPAHVTDLRRDNTVTNYAQLVGPPGGPFVATTQHYDIHERFHQHIGGGTVGGAILDRYMASIANSRPNSPVGYELFAATVNHAARTVNIIVPVGGVGTHPLISPRTQGR